MNKNKTLLISMLPLISLLLIRPLGMNYNQSLVLGLLFMVIIWWSTKCVPQMIASSFLIIAFLIFGNSTTSEILGFVISSSFFMIILSYVFSVAIMNSGIIQKKLYPFIYKYASSPKRTLVLIVLTIAILTFTVPQPFARLILLASFFDNYLRDVKAKKETREILLFSAFFLQSVFSFIMLDADIILNRAAVAFSGENITNIEWIKHMAIPSFIYLIICSLIIRFLFRKELDTKFILSENKRKTEIIPLEKTLWFILILTIFLWMSEAFHSISSVIIMTISLMLLFIIKKAKIEDLKSIEISSLVFLTAAIPIGRVLYNTGISEIVFSRLSLILYGDVGIRYIFTMATLAMIMHLIIGSTTATLSLVIPGLVSATKGAISAQAIMYISYISASAHAILPYHFVPYVIAEAKGYYPARILRKYGIILIPIVFIVLLFIFIPWWKITGLI